MTDTDTEYDTFEHGIGLTTLESESGAVDSIQESSPVAINGVALPENTVLEGGLGERHVYPPEAAQRAADVLREQIEDPETTVHVVKNFHEPEGRAPADDIIGEVTSAAYREGVGVVFSGEITDEPTAQKIEMGYLDVSPTVARSLGAFDDALDAAVVDEVAGFRDIAIVGQGQPGADVEIGPNPAIEALSRAVEFAPTEGTETDTMSLEDAKETLAEEYDLAVDELEDRLTASDDPAEPDNSDELPDGVVRLIEP